MISMIGPNMEREDCHPRKQKRNGKPLQSHPLENVHEDCDSFVEEGALCRICWGEGEESEGAFLEWF